MAVTSCKYPGGSDSIFQGYELDLCVYTTCPQITLIYITRIFNNSNKELRELNASGQPVTITRTIQVTPQGNTCIPVHITAHETGSSAEFIRIYYKLTADGPEVAQYLEVRAPNKDCSDATAPSAPTGLAVARDTNGKAVLSWTGSSDNLSVYEYQVAYKDPSNSSWIPIATVTGTTATTYSYTFANLAVGTWDFRVTAVDPSGNASVPAELLSQSI